MLPFIAKQKEDLVVYGGIPAPNPYKLISLEVL
jgi:hypothetical protein